MEEMSKHVMLMLVTMSQYFDENEFEVSPVKTEIKTQYFNFKLGQSYV